MVGLLLLSGCALFQPNTQCGSIPEPPAQYDHYPTAHFTVVWIPWGEKGFDCNDSFAEACSTPDGFGNWYIIMPKGEAGWWTACALRHEYGHINGWPADHSGARYL